MLTADVRRAIAARARTIDERVESFRQQPIVRVDPVDPAGLDALASWARAFAPGNPEALAHRLAWDGLTPDRAAAALDAPPGDGLPGWIEWVDRIADAAREIARTGRVEDDKVSAVNALPYAGIWSAVLRAAHDRIDAGLPALDRQLLRELSAAGELAVDEWYSKYLDARGIDRRSLTAGSSDAYRAFVLSSLGDGLTALLTAHPVLARQVATIAGCWTVSTRELVERFAADRGAIAAALNGGVDPGPIVDVEAGLSDPHDGRRRVSILHCASGLRIVYKPRDVAIEAAFASLVAWLAARGFEPALRASRVVARRGYGWVELAAHESFDSDAGVRRYFRQAGALMFVTHLLGSRDLHMENIVATREGPVVIDLELLLQPELTAGAGDADRSCLRTGLLSLVELGPGDDVFDVGGLRGTGRVPLAAARRQWRHAGTDAVVSVEEAVVRADVRNSVVLDGVRQAPDEYRAEILDGFSRAYRFAQAHRDEWLDPGGPLAAFKPAVVRVIVRPTNQYALLMTVQNAPRYQHDGAVRSMLVDVLNRPLAGAVERPREWPLMVEERRALEAGDVPRFGVAADGRTLMSEGRVILPDYFAKSPLESVRARLAGLSDADRESQERALDAALGESIESRFGVPFESGAGDFSAAAEWIGHEMRRRATGRGDAIVWARDDPGGAFAHHLYGRSLGPAVFLSALAAASGSASWQRAARAALLPAVAWSESGPIERDAAIGGSTGLGSIVYGLTTAAALLGDGRAIDAARRVAIGIDRDRIARDRAFDVVDGTAGALLALLALHNATGDASLLDRAAACGDHLVASRVEHPAGWTWPASSPGDRRRLVGFAHGAAGIGCALSRLAVATESAIYRDAAARAFAFVAGEFSTAEENWPVAAPDASDISTAILRMSAWCHGAPGIAIAVATSTADAALESQARQALDRLPEWAPNQADHVCCGHLGRIDALLTAGAALGAADPIARAQSIGGRVLARARERRHFRLSTPGFEYRVFDPGFFKGLSGIGYGFLRLAEPDRVPSIASFEVLRSAFTIR